MAGDLIEGGEIRALRKRHISEETCRKFGYRVATEAGKTYQVAPYYNREGHLVAQKLRSAGKRFSTRGDFKTAMLFGQNVWGQGGRRVVVTEGEIDCLSVSQVQGNKWPVVSIPNGAPGARKSLQANIEWLESYEEVVLLFDQDDVGAEAVESCVSLFSPGKCRVATIPMKDANEMLVAGRGDELIRAIWNAKVYRPDGIITLADVREEVLQDIEPGIPWPYPTLTRATYGRRRGEVYTFGAGTGIGKTELFMEVLAYTAFDLGLPCGGFFLEQPPTETVKRLAGKVGGRRFHVPDGSWTVEELQTAMDTMEGSSTLYLYNHFGATDWDTIQSRIRYLVVNHGVRDIFLDHLTALAAHADDERRALETIMADFAGMAQELQFTGYLISHLATPDGRPHEEGGRVMIRHFKGSRAIGYWSHFMFGLERDQQAEDDDERKLTTFRILKDRYTGAATGQTFYLTYDFAQGKLVEYTPEDEEADEFAAALEDEDGIPF